MIGDSNWLLWLLGAGSLGSIISPIVNKLLKSKAEKDIDIVNLTSQIAQAFEHTLRVTTEASARDRAMLEGRLYRLEATVEEVRLELDTYREITSNAYDCSLLKGNPDFQCPVIASKRDYNVNKYDLIQSLKDGEPIKS